jgi:hypothetical protein
MTTCYFLGAIRRSRSDRQRVEAGIPISNQVTIGHDKTCADTSYTYSFISGRPRPIVEIE